MLCLNKINTSTVLEDIEEAFTIRDFSIKYLKNVKVKGSLMALVIF